MGRVYQESSLDAMNEGARRQFDFEGYDEGVLGHSLEEIFEHDFDKMVSYAETQDEKYAIGYIRTGANSRFSKSDSATKRLYEEGEQQEQEFAIQHYARENGYVKFHSVVDDQISVVGFEESFSWLKMMLRLCEKKNATLLYCELGSVFRHPEFFAIIKNARKLGIKLEAVRDIRALEAAQRQARKPKLPRKKGTRKKRLAQEQLALEERNPILKWKDAQKQPNGKSGVPTKRFNTYEHFYRGADPIYEFFIRPNDKDQNLEDTSLWKPIIAYDRDIAYDLHRGGYLTVEGYAWSKESVRKARNIVFSDEFKSYCGEKNRLAREWEIYTEYSI